MVSRPFGGGLIVCVIPMKTSLLSFTDWSTRTRVDGPYYQPNTWGPGLTVGGGLDYETPWFNHHLAIRLFQADYEYMHVDFGPDGLRRQRQHQRGAAERGHCDPCRLHRATASDHAGVLGEPGIDLSRRSGHGDGDGGWSEPEGPRDL